MRGTKDHHHESSHADHAHAASGRSKSSTKRQDHVSAKSRSHAKKRKGIHPKYFFLFGLGLGTAVLDQVTKILVVKNIRLGETVPVIMDYFNLTYARNTGAAFGFMAGANPAIRIPFFIIVPLVALGTIAYVFRKIPDEEKKLAVALSLVIGGAVGNLIDRVFLGYVVDFLDFHWRWRYHFATFNIADTAICIGVGLVILDLFVRGEDSPEEKKGAHA